VRWIPIDGMSMADSGRSIYLLDLVGFSLKQQTKLHPVDGFFFGFIQLLRNPTKQRITTTVRLSELDFTDFSFCHF